MAYRKVSMIEIKEILLRIAKGQSKRGIRKDLSVHGLTTRLPHFQSKLNR